MTDNYPYFVQHDRSQIAKAVTPRYSFALPSPQGPIIVDPHLRVEAVFKGLRYPTSMAFLGTNDILFTEKDAGTVRRVVNGTELRQPLLNVSVATYAHRGLLGIAVAPPTTAASSINHKIRNSITYVFLYYTQAQTHTGDDIT